jgi:hypothetical protein
VAPSAGFGLHKGGADFQITAFKGAKGAFHLGRVFVTLMENVKLIIYLSRAIVVKVIAAAVVHTKHPRFQRDIKNYIFKVLACAAEAVQSFAGCNGCSRPLTI